MRFQAKQIQELLGIPKHRYEYIASKIGIKPEIEEVEGQGHTHLYSLKNLLQFAFVHSANSLGLTPKASREMLSYLDKVDSDRLLNLGIYSPENFEDISVHFVNDFGTKYFCATYAVKGQESRVKLEPKYGSLVPGEPALELFKSIGFVTINIRSLKIEIMEKMKQ